MRRGRVKWCNRYQSFPALRYAQAVYPKAGITSFKQLARDLGMEQPRPYPTNEQIRKARDTGIFTALFVRHPLDRVCSLWRYFGQTDSPRFRRVSGPTALQWYRRLGLPDPGSFSFGYFVRHLASGASELDEHTATIHWQHRDERGLIPEFVWPFEDIERGWSAIKDRVPGLPDRLPHSNSTATCKPWRSYFDPPTLRIAEAYWAQDLEFWEEVYNASRRAT